MRELMSTKSEPNDAPYWQRKSLDEMTNDEWERLCDGCGRCCMLKLEDEDTGDVHLTRIACKLLDIGKCRCSDYKKRHEKVPDCLRLTPELTRELGWLPETCAYRLIDEGKELAWWHPLISGDAQTVHLAGVSVRTWAMTETPSRAQQLFRYIIVED